MVVAEPKIDAYLAYRQEREKEIKGLLKAEGKLPYEYVFQEVYKHKNVDKDEMLREMAITSFNAQINKL
jgi:hypothetical protein